MEQSEDDRRSRMERLTLRMSAVQTFIAVTSFVVAIIALYAALNEADAARKQLQSSAWPNLETEFSFRTVPGSERLEFSLRNSGIGPAKVQSIELFFDGAPLDTWDQLVRTFTETETRSTATTGFRAGFCSRTINTLCSRLPLKRLVAKQPLPFRTLLKRVACRAKSVIAPCLRTVGRSRPSPATPWRLMRALSLPAIALFKIRQ